MNIIYHINRLKLDAEKTFGGKNQISLHDKSSGEILEIQATCFNIRKAIYNNPTANIKLNREKLRQFH